jgi:DNA-binding LacI/PurR family transcriptional regulator
MKVTMTDLARELNLSVSTVSRALKHDDRISKKVQESVNQLAQQWGYQPNLLARSLVNDKTYSIGLVINDISWSFFSELAQHVQNACENHGYSLFLYSSGDDPRKEIIGVDSLIARRIDGLIVYSHESAENIAQLERTSKAGCPVVIFNNLENVALDIITIDNSKGTGLVMDYLLGLGHCRIAYVGPKPVKSVEKERLGGYEIALKEKCGSVDRSLVCTGKAHPLIGYEATRELLRKPKRPTAIVAYNDNIALGVNRAILEAGLRIPEDISVVGSDGLEICLTAYPPLTTVSSPLKQMANMAVEILIQRIQAIDEGVDGTIFTPQNIKLLPQLVIRSSTGGGK